MRTASQLVAHVIMARDAGWKYLYGTFGQRYSQALLDYKLKQYPAQISHHLDYILANHPGHIVTDCVGAIKACVWWDDKLGVPVYQRATDRSADGAFHAALVKGPLVTLPNRPGICVWRSGHIGVYIGNGRVIEAKGTRHGVVETPLTGNGSNGWTHWLEYPEIDYEEKPMLTDWKEILKDALLQPDDWERGVMTVQAAAAAGGNLGDMEIMRYLPEAIAKVYAAGHRAGTKGE